MNKQTKQKLKEAIATILMCFIALVIITVIMQCCVKIFL